MVAHIHTLTHTHTHTHTYTYTHIHTRTRTHTHTHDMKESDEMCGREYWKRTRTHSHMYTLKHMYTHTYTHTRSRTLLLFHVYSCQRAGTGMCLKRHANGFTTHAPTAAYNGNTLFMVLPHLRHSHTRTHTHSPINAQQRQ